MKHLVGIGVLIAFAFILRSGLRPNLGLDIYAHDAYWAIPFGVVAFWCLGAIGNLNPHGWLPRQDLCALQESSR